MKKIVFDKLSVVLFVLLIFFFLLLFQPFIIPYFGYYFFSAFLTILISPFVLKPLSSLLAKNENSSTIYVQLILFRFLFIFFIIPLFPDLPVFEMLFFIPVSAFITYLSKKRLSDNNDAILERKCSACGAPLDGSQIVCSYCGTENVIDVAAEKNFLFHASAGTTFQVDDYPFYGKSEDQALQMMIQEELAKNNESENVSVPAFEKKKNIFTLIYVIILFLCISLYFFHTQRIVLFLIVIVATFIYFKGLKNYTIVSYLSREIKSRPDEKISYIVASTISSKADNANNRLLRIVLVIFAICVPLFIFREPRVIYEKQGDDYVIRFYTLGAFRNDTTLIIPEFYNGGKVVGIRGDVFANVNTLREVVLPETITEIRGGAFKNAHSLKKINLPEGITEVKGNTFEGCSNLESIVIPEGVTRIGGSAFRDCLSLKEATIPSTVKEIGSSAFRNTALTEVCVSRSALVNERAFKETNAVVYYYESGCGGIIYE